MESAKRIRELRENSGFTRKEFSEHIGIPVRTLEDWESRKANTSGIYSWAGFVSIEIRETDSKVVGCKSFR